MKRLSKEDKLSATAPARSQSATYRPKNPRQLPPVNEPPSGKTHVRRASRSRTRRGDAAAAGRSEESRPRRR